ncbi:MAG TPA: hypothetical protein PKU94_08590 [Candidatus Hydrothermia bacterium]|nr:hypothetical protein [Candidatus Hydrothermia bacterium]
MKLKKKPLRVEKAKYKGKESQIFLFENGVIEVSDIQKYTEEEIEEMVNEGLSILEKARKQAEEMKEVEVEDNKG